jgi:RNA polymerase sigma-70 factor, ECF subfamily
LWKFFFSEFRNIIGTTDETLKIFMIMAESHQITQLLIDWSKGNELALEQLFPLVYEELRRMARSYMRRQPSGHTFQTTELIHEAYIKLAKNDEKNWQNRAHFFGVAAQAMRHILVDYARSKHSKKRGGWQERVTLSENAPVSAEHSEQIVELDDVLKQLATMDERKSRVVELKFFGGLNIEEIAEVLKISPETVKRDWRFARTWLLRELAGAK